MITTLALVLFTCTANPVTELDKCSYEFVQTYQREAEIREDMIDCLTALKGYPDVIGVNGGPNSYGYAACMMVYPMVNRPGVALLQNIEVLDDSFLEDANKIDGFTLHKGATK